MEYAGLAHVKVTAQVAPVAEHIVSLVTMTAFPHAIPAHVVNSKVCLDKVVTVVQSPPAVDTGLASIEIGTLRASIPILKFTSLGMTEVTVPHFESCHTMQCMGMTSDGDRILFGVLQHPHVLNNWVLRAP